MQVYTINLRSGGHIGFTQFLNKNKLPMFSLYLQHMIIYSIHVSTLFGKNVMHVDIINLVVAAILDLYTFHR